VLAIAELLIKARIARGWSQTQLASALGIAVQQVQRYEASGYASASLTRLADVAKALGIDVSETAHLRLIAGRAAPSYGSTRRA
jgi:transcriptional regulator with XRE-family HTH domain